VAWLSLGGSVATSVAAALPSPSPLGRNLTRDLTAAVGIGSTVAVVGVLLPSIARRQGIEPMGLAILAALPFLANLVTLFAGRVGPRTPARMGLLRAFGALSLLLVVVAPDPFLIAVAIFAFWMSFALGTPLQQRIWATIYASRDRGRLLGYVGTVRLVAGTLALIAITVAAASSGWMLIIVVVALVGAVLALSIRGMEVPGIEIHPRYGAMESIRSVAGGPVLRGFVTAQLLFGAGLLAAPAFQAMVYIDRLHLGVDDIALAGLVGYATGAATIGLWGRMAGRVGPLHTIGAGSIIGVVAMMGFAFAADFHAIVIATVLLSVAGASVDASWPLLIADHAPFETQTQVAAGINSIMGVRGLVVPFVFMAPIALGITNETGGLLICATVMAAGAVVYARLSGLDVIVGRSLRRAGGWLAAQRRPATAES
jgi:MFS family permease